jgi:hypothetical protein
MPETEIEEVAIRGFTMCPQQPDAEPTTMTLSAEVAKALAHHILSALESNTDAGAFTIKAGEEVELLTVLKPIVIRE